MIVSAAGRVYQGGIVVSSGSCAVGTLFAHHELAVNTFVRLVRTFYQQTQNPADQSREKDHQWYDRDRLTLPHLAKHTEHVHAQASDKTIGCPAPRSIGAGHPWVPSLVGVSRPASWAIRTTSLALVCKRRSAIA